jgi:hypothetical protein
MCPGPSAPSQTHPAQYGTIADNYTELGDFEQAALNYDKYIKVRRAGTAGVARWGMQRGTSPVLACRKGPRPVGGGPAVDSPGTTAFSGWAVAAPPSKHPTHLTPGPTPSC